MGRRNRSRGRYDGYWPPYVPVAERRAQALREVAKLRKTGEVIEPVEIEGRMIARSFWGKGWCRHLESFGDYKNRLPRGRTYVRNGSVCHLSITRGRVEARVAGSSLYRVRVEVAPLPSPTWATLKQQCMGKIGSLIELLQGTLSDEIMNAMTDRRGGLFPQPGEITYTCNCPDWAGMCKHISAVMYGIGARLDTQPELLFRLRGVDHEELLVAHTAMGGMVREGSRRARRRSLSHSDMESVFGVELDAPTEPDPALSPPKGRRTTPRARAGKKTGSKAKAAFRPTARSVAALRKRLGMSQVAFAKAVGVSAATVANWEKTQGPIKPQAKGLAGLNRLHAQ